MINNKIFIASDHAGFNLKQDLVKYLHDNYSKLLVVDYGTKTAASVDYPDFGHLVAKEVNKDKGLGIVICGSGNGINMTVNKYKNVRSALCWSTEITSLARAHNDANILALPARFIAADLAKKIVDKFLTTDFENGRHKVRIQKISNN